MSSAGCGAIFDETGGEHINPVYKFELAEVFPLKADIAKMNKAKGGNGFIFIMAQKILEQKS